MENNNKALMHALLGQGELALDLLAQLPQPLSFELSLAKAQTHLNLGQTQDAIETLDNAPQTNAY